MKPLFAVLCALCLALLVGLLPQAAWADEAWLLVSDIHLNPFDKSSIPSGYGSDSNWALWTSALRAMRQSDPNPALVVVSGDFLAHHFGALVSANGGSDVTAAAEAAMARIARSLDSAFPRAQFLVVLGNNDDPCGDYRTAAGSRYLAAVARIWDPLVDRRNAAPGFARTFSTGGYYTASLAAVRLRAVALDDVFWSVLYHPCGKVPGNPGEAELGWLTRTLAQRHANERDVVVAHIPPGVDAAGTLLARRLAVIPYLDPSEDLALRTELSREKRHIAFAIAGHAHRSDFRIVGGVPMLVAPSISPIYNNNPAFLSLRVAGDGTLRDYVLYAYDAARKSWTTEFDFDRAYRVRSFDASSLQEAHVRIESDASIRGRWAEALVAGSPQAEVDASNWRTVWCAQTSVGHSYNACAHLRRRLLVLPIAAGLLFVVVAASVVLIVLRMTSRRRR